MPVVSVIALLLAAAPLPTVAAAQQQADDFDFPGALKTLDLVLAQPGNDRPTTLAALELQGVVWGNLNKPARARAAFLTLLTLDPGRDLSGDHPPRVRTPFYEAKEQVERQGALTLSRGVPAFDGDQVVQVSVQLSRDALKLVRGIRFHLQIAANRRTAAVVPDAAGRAVVDTVGDEVQWWAEAIGDREAVLLVLGGADAPLVDRKPRPSPAAPAAPTAPAAISLTQSPPSRGWLRPTGIGLAIAGVAAFGVASFFGVTSSSARASILGASRDATGAINGLTQVQAAAADRRAQDSALIANALFGVGGGLAALGLACFIVAGTTSVAIAPAGAGLAAQGTF